MNKKMITILIAALSLVSLSLAAFRPMNTEPVEIDRYGGPGNRVNEPMGDSTCDADCDGDYEARAYGANTFSDQQVGYGNQQVVNGTSVQGNGNFGAFRGSGIGLGELSTVEAEGLIMAIEEEYLARALYESVIDTFGTVTPFVEIAASEANHAETLIRQAEKYGIEYPAYDSAAFELPTFASVEEALQAGVDAEIADAALYDTLMADTTRTDLIRVYTQLQSASLNNHLVSFQDYLTD